jgi:hypothetical protein
MGQKDETSDNDQGPFTTIVGVAIENLGHAMPQIDRSIAQALFEGDSLRARSANFADDWLAAATLIHKEFGTPLPETAWPEALIARPLAKNCVAVVSVAGPSPYSPIRFRFLVLGSELYYHLNDPFAIADRYPPDWEARGQMADLEWPPEPLPRRTITQLDEILKHGDGPFLLGAAQTLVDGGKIVLQRPAPEPRLLCDLWALLPESTRRTVWPATFAPDNPRCFDLVVTPSLPVGGMPGYLGEDQARDYPDSRYERNLQVAIESGDQVMLDRLLSRRGSSDTLRLALTIVLLAVGILTIVKALTALKVL